MRFSCLPWLWDVLAGEHALLSHSANSGPFSGSGFRTTLPETHTRNSQTIWFPFSRHFVVPWYPWVGLGGPGGHWLGPHFGSRAGRAGPVRPHPIHHPSAPHPRRPHPIHFSIALHRGIISLKYESIRPSVRSFRLSVAPSGPSFRPSVRAALRPVRSPSVRM